MDPRPLIHFALGLVLAPLLPGIINRVKAVFAGRRGKPLLQTYYDLAKLLGKGAVYSKTTTFVFRAAPLVCLAGVAAALCFAPLGKAPALLSFSGDFVMAAYLLALARLALILGALDTGSSFEGMGASREAFFAALGEPVLFACFLVLVQVSGSLSLSSMLSFGQAFPVPPELALVPVTLFILLLSENARIPVDDPNTHLELTMIHEVMILDHGGPDLAFLTYAASLKLWFFAVLLAGAVPVPPAASPWLDTLVGLTLILVAALAVGVVESVMARLRLLRVPKLLAAAAACASVTLILTIWR